MNKAAEEIFGWAAERFKIFEVGSAGGRDAMAIQTLGYTNITVSDVANYFFRTIE